MLVPGPAPLAGVVLAHPVTAPFQLPVSPLVAAFAAAGLVLLLAFASPEGGRPPGAAREGDETTSWSGALTAPQVVTRLVAGAVLVLAVAAGRSGADNELDNLAPALVVGAAWPLLVFASIAFGPVWRWTDPWDGVARLFTRAQPDAHADHVWPAVLFAVGWTWYLSAYPDTLEPRSVGAILAIYTVVTVAGCLAAGRQRWLSASEPLGIVLSWLALLPRRRLADWNPPRGAEILLGVLAGGVLFGAVRRSELWGGLNTVEDARLVAALGLVASCAAGAALLLAMAPPFLRPHARAAAARATVPALAGIVVAVAMDRNRLFTSAQLLPELFGDPFGRGWDPFGRAGARLDPAPLGVAGLLAAQLAVLLAGFVAGALVLGRRLVRRDRGIAAVGLSVLAGASVLAVLSH